MKPFFEENGLDFKNMAAIIIAAAELKKLIVDNKKIAREGPVFTKIAELNKMFRGGEISIEQKIEDRALKSSGRLYKRAIFNFKKENKPVNVLFFEDEDILTNAELTELNIRDAHKHRIDCPGLDGVWFVGSASAVKPSMLKEIILDGVKVTKDILRQKVAEMMSGEFDLNVRIVNDSLEISTLNRLTPNAHHNQIARPAIAEGVICGRISQNYGILLFLIDKPGISANIQEFRDQYIRVGRALLESGMPPSFKLDWRYERLLPDLFAKAPETVEDLARQPILDEITTATLVQPETSLSVQKGPVMSKAVRAGMSPDTSASQTHPAPADRKGAPLGPDNIHSMGAAVNEDLFPGANRDDPVLGNGPQSAAPAPSAHRSLEQYLKSNGNIREDINKFTTLLDEEGKKKLLEIGCGSGAVAHEIARANPEINILATDRYGLYHGDHFKSMWENRGLVPHTDPLSNLAVAKTSVAIIEQMPDSSLDYILLVAPDVEVVSYMMDNAQTLVRKLKVGGQIILRPFYQTRFHSGYFQGFEEEGISFNIMPKGFKFLGSSLESDYPFSRDPMETDNVLAWTKKDNGPLKQPAYANLRSKTMDKIMEAINKGASSISYIDHCSDKGIKKEMSISDAFNFNTVRRLAVLDDGRFHLYADSVRFTTLRESRDAVSSEAAHDQISRAKTLIEAAFAIAVIAGFAAIVWRGYSFVKELILRQINILKEYLNLFKVFGRNTGQENTLTAIALGGIFLSKRHPEPEKIEKFIVAKCAELSKQGYSIQQDDPYGNFYSWHVIKDDVRIGHIRLEAVDGRVVIREIYPGLPADHEYGRAVLSLFLLLNNRWTGHKIVCETSSRSAYRMFRNMENSGNFAVDIKRSWEDHWIVLGRIPYADPSLFKKVQKTGIFTKPGAEKAAYSLWQDLYPVKSSEDIALNIAPLYEETAWGAFKYIEYLVKSKIGWKAWAEKLPALSGVFLGSRSASVLLYFAALSILPNNPIITAPAITAIAIANSLIFASMHRNETKLFFVKRALLGLKFNLPVMALPVFKIIVGQFMPVSSLEDKLMLAVNFITMLPFSVYLHKI